MASSNRGRRGPSNRTNAILQQTEGHTPGLQRRVVAVRGPIVPRRELKYLDIASATYAVNTTGSVTLLNGVAEGDDNTGRTGRQVMMRSVGITGFVRLLPAGTSNTPQRARLLLVWDNASNGAAPAVLDILSAATAQSFHNVDTESRFTILWDHTAVLGTFSLVSGTTSADQTIKDINVVVPLASVTQYIGTSAAQASVGNGGLYLLVIGTAAAGSLASEAILAARVRFSDEE